jgi:hypothetical protein
MLPEDFLADVEMASGRPVVLSRYGWRKMSVDGKKYIVAMTKEEAIEVLRAEGVEDPEGILSGGCASDEQYTKCYKIGNCKKKCKLKFSGSSGIWMCVCA